MARPIPELVRKFQVSRRLLADATNDLSATGIDIPDIIFRIEAGEVWSFEAYLKVGCGGAGGGVNFAMGIPTNASHLTQVFGNTADSVTFKQAILSGTGFTSVPLNSNAGSSGMVRLAGVVIGGDTAGMVRIRFRPQTNGETATIFGNSYIIARRIS